MQAEDSRLSQKETTQTIRIITRKSQLAIAQTYIVIERLQHFYPHLEFRVEKIETSGDKNLTQPLPLIGGKGVFTEELERALLEERADLAVHSLKDLPIELPAGLTIGACLPREDPSDAVVFRDPSSFRTLQDLPPNSIVGTSSLRRKYTLQNLYPKLRVKDIRGNLQTRLAKLKNTFPGSQTQYDAIVLAAAGLKRAEISDYYQLLPDETFMHAPGQGFLAIECKQDSHISELLKCFTNPISEKIHQAERSLLKSLGGGCHTPLSVYTSVDQDVLTIKAILYDDNGEVFAAKEASASLESADNLGHNLALSMRTNKP
ncbi:Porphobilinogen deaminase [Perkinsela sp. CCAP 1560/4]|nr:Porphobilinogen deaminase [Perkinsela sp. CCAP 1560/4]|eukprot:KNH08749.1 Porphobilinogen deaminase [Perkinsela sp. CCAP 1560/4]